MDVAKRVQQLGRVRQIPERWHTPLLGVAGLVFVVGTVLAYRGLDIAITQVRVSLLLVVLLVGTPLTIAVNAAELRVIARAGATLLSWRDATRTVVLATAANLLPVPGAAMVRTHALVSHGMTLAAAVRLILASAVVWVGVSAWVAGVAAVSLSTAAAAVLASSGAVAVIVGLAVFASRVRVSAELLAVELCTTLLHAARLWLVLLALGVTVDVREPVVLSAAAPLAAAAGVFPSGLGLAEGLAAAIGAAIGLTAAAGFAATAVMRVVGLAGTAVAAVLLGVSHRLGDSIAGLTGSEEHGSP